MNSISVIIPTYNREHTLKKCIDSVLAQSYPSNEIIIIDDGSTDNTENLIKYYVTQHSSVKYFKTQNFGVSHARNFGITKSNSDWISFLDSDDTWLKNKLKLQIKKVTEENRLWCHGEEIWIRNGVRVNQKKKHKKSGGNQFKRSLELCCISPSAVMIHNSIFKKFKFNENYEVCEDYDLWIQLSCLYPISFVEEPIIEKTGGHEDQLSRKYFAMDLWRIKSIASLLKNQINLSNEQKKLATTELFKKASILKKGYLKHDRALELKELIQITKDFIEL